MRKIIKKQVDAKQPKSAPKLPSFFTLCASTWREITAFWRPLSGVVLIYSLLYFVLVLGLSTPYSYQDVADAIFLQLGDNAGWLATKSLTIANLFIDTNQSASTAIVQFLLFVIATLALIWVLRQLRGLKHIKMRDAYFDGTARIVPTTLVIILLLIPFIPAVIGSAIFAVAQTGSSFEPIVGGVIALLLLFVSLIWFCAWLPALYIVSLPKGTPISALRSAAKLTKKRRFWMLRNLLLFAIVTAIIVVAVMLLFVTIAPFASVVAAYISSFVAFGVAQTFLFITYRGLLDES